MTDRQVARTTPGTTSPTEANPDVARASRLTDAQLVEELARLARGEREATVALIASLAEFDARRLYEPAGFSSTFKYCLDVLRLSEDAAFNRIEAARTARRFPAVLEMLATGALSPTTARMLSRHLTPRNHRDLLREASGKSKSEVERLLASVFPRPDVPSSVRRVPERKGPSVIGPRAVAAAASDPPRAIADPAVSPPPEATPSPAAPSAAAATPPSVGAPSSHGPQPLARSVVRPLAPRRYEIRFTAGAETYEKLRLAQELLGHAVPSGDLAQVVDRALTLLVADLRRKKFSATSRPGRSRGQRADSRNVPASVRRAVAARDDGCCAFISADGRRCRERHSLEFHHVNPYGAKGRPTVANIELRCRAHNRYEAVVFYGPGRAYCAGAPVPVPERVPPPPGVGPPT